MRLFIGLAISMTLVLAHTPPALAQSETPSAPSPNQIACQNYAALPVSQRARDLRDLARAKRDAFAREKRQELDVEGIPIGTETKPAWQRVLDYYDIADVRGSLYVTHASGASSTRFDEVSMRPRIERAFTDPNHREVVRDAFTRAALYDTPWSGAFISAMMRTASFSELEFTASAGHINYMVAALRDGFRQGGQAYAACHPAWVRPRVGDLVCYSRSTRSPRSYEQLQLFASGQRGFASTAMHCDIVVLSAPDARALETIGGNLSQTVKLTSREFGPRAGATLSTVAPTKPDEPWVAALILARP